jgi:hypothetical protein
LPEVLRPGYSVDSWLDCCARGRVGSVTGMSAGFSADLY